MLKKLVTISAVSGMENDIRDFLKEQLNSCCHKLEIDGMGNLHAFHYGEGPRFTLLTYMDEPGVIVTKITDDGYLCFETIGRINPAFLVSKRVCFGDIMGVISLKAIHLTTKKEREIPIKVSQLFIDIGASSKEEAEAKIDVGDYGSLDIPYRDSKNGFIKGRALAGRMGCSVAVKLLKKTSNHNIHVIFAVQREIKNRGILGYKDLNNTDYLISLDGIKSKDYITKKDYTPEVGKGVVIVSTQPGGRLTCNDNTSKKIADALEIPSQFGVAEDNIIDLSAYKEYMKEPKYVSFAIPVRYSDSISPIAKIGDMDAMYRLVDGYINAMIKEEEE